MKSLDVESVSEKLTKKKEMTGISYDTDLIDYQWEILKLLIPLAKTGGRNRSVNMREVLNAIFYLLAKLNGIKWRAINQQLREQVRIQAGKNRLPSVDSQSVKTAMGMEQNVLIIKEWNC